MCSGGDLVCLGVTLGVFRGDLVCLGVTWCV